MPKFSMQSADFVLGQSSFETNRIGFTATSFYSPYKSMIVANKLFVLDINNHRILGWNSIPTTSNVPADFALGQTDLNSRTENTTNISGSTLYFPIDMYSDGTKFFVADGSNSRILVWNTIPTTNAAPATYAIGQPDLLTRTMNHGGLSATSLSIPSSVTMLGEKLVIGDAANGRILIWNTVPSNATTAANSIIGLANFTTPIQGSPSFGSSTLTAYFNVATSDNKIYAVDRFANRILVWNQIPPSGTTGADTLLGQPNFTSTSPNAGGISEETLYEPFSFFGTDRFDIVADGRNHRVIIRSK